LQRRDDRLDLLAAPDEIRDRGAQLVARAARRERRRSVQVDLDADDLAAGDRRRVHRAGCVDGLVRCDAKQFGERRLGFEASQERIAIGADETGPLAFEQVEQLRAELTARAIARQQIDALAQRHAGRELAPDGGEVLRAQQRQLAVVEARQNALAQGGCCRHGVKSSTARRLPRSPLPTPASTTGLAVHRGQCRPRSAMPPSRSRRTQRGKPYRRPVLERRSGHTGSG
jgi:hypothetical protein